jgi:hypothetical protein
MKRLSIAEWLTIALHVILHGFAVYALLNDRPDISLFVFMLIFCLLSSFLNDEQQIELIDSDR